MNLSISNTVKYKNGNYTVIFCKDDGTKIRCLPDEEGEFFIPSFAENIDITITQHCDAGCLFCYANCSKTGEHADLFKYKFLSTLHPGTEIAINGNDLSHPQLEDFLNYLKNSGIFTNITINQFHFNSKRIETLKSWQDRGLIHGIGVSYTSPTKEFAEVLKNSGLKNIVIHTICGIIDKGDLDFLKGLHKPILVLGYKIKGRGDIYYAINKSAIEVKTNWLASEIVDLWNTVGTVSFDNLALQQLDIRSKISEKEWESCYMGDEGSSTFYIDMVKGTFSRSSMDTETFPILNELDDVDEMFRFIVKHYGGKIDGVNKI